MNQDIQTGRECDKRDPEDSLSGYLRLPQVLHLYPVSRSTWWAGVKSGRFPAPVKLTPRTSAWRVRDIRALIEQAAAENV
jgi:prophage regulatory protein